MKGITYIGSAMVLLSMSFSWMSCLQTDLSMAAGLQDMSLPKHYAASVEVTLFSNDSLAALHLGGRLVSETSLDTLLEANFALDISPIPYSACIKTVNDSQMYLERWDTLPQTRFWRQVMTLERGTYLVNVAKTRQILGQMPVIDWETKNETAQEIFRDSLRNTYGLAEDASIFFTAGKQHYYQFRKAMPSVSRGVEIFTHLEIDPWYAQAILLIESPGQLHTSPVGAYGSFQLMEQVALEHGLVVNDSVDERADFDKAAKAAADLISSRCIPQIRHILRKHQLPFRESDLWFRLMVLHAYHAGAGNVDGVLSQIRPTTGGVSLIQQMWRTEYGGFKNASQNYSQVALASLLELDRLMQLLPDTICQEQQVWAAKQNAETEESAPLLPPKMAPIPELEFGDILVAE